MHLFFATGLASFTTLSGHSGLRKNSQRFVLGSMPQDFDLDATNLLVVDKEFLDLLEQGDKTFALRRS